MARVGRRSALLCVFAIASACGRSGLAPLIPGHHSSAAYCDAADPTLAGCWTFEGNVADLSSYGNQPDLVQGTSYQPGIDQAALISTGGTMVHLPDSPSLDLTTALTIEMWVAPSSAPSGGGTMYLFDDDGQYAIVWHNNGDLQYVWSGVNNAGNTIGGDLLPIGEWSHVAVTWNGTVWTYFVDGGVVDSRTAPGRLQTGGSGGSRIGGNSPAGNTLFGAIDDLRIFRRALPAAQICSDGGAC